MPSAPKIEFLGKNDEVGLHFAIERASDLQKSQFSSAQVRVIFFAREK
jgi:hypothetical protein